MFKMKVVYSKIAPNPKETNYWGDLTANAYGKIIKVWSKGKWQPLAGEGGGSISTDVDYRDVDNKPKINGVELNGDLSLDELGIIDHEDVANAIPSEYITEDELAEVTYSKEEIQDIASNIEGSNAWTDVK